MPTMPRKLPLYVVREKSRHGRVKYYFRRGRSARIRLPDDPSSDEFHHAYMAAMSGKEPARKAPEAPAKSLRWLIDRYRESAKWKAYSAATKKQHDNFFRSAIASSGNADFRLIDRKDMEAAMDARADTPALANNFLKAMKALFDWAVRNDHIDVNPAVGVERVRYKTEGFPAWTVEDYRQFCDRWPIGTKQRLAVELILHTGLRRSDIVHLGRQHIKGQTVTITTAKTGIPITAEIPRHVMEIIEASPTGDLALLVSETGQPFTKESFGNWFRDQCSAAGISKSAHGIRKLAATLAADGGAPAHELMAQFGWTNIKQAEVYTRGADRKVLGVKSSRRISSQLRVRDTRRKAK